MPLTLIGQTGDGNGTVEKEELKCVDKNGELFLALTLILILNPTLGKLFAKLDASSSGHVSVESWLAYFGEMKTANEKVSSILDSTDPFYTHSPTPHTSKPDSNSDGEGF